MQYDKGSTLNRRKFIYSVASGSLVKINSLKAQTQADVIVIGGGLSGLYAANILSEEGARVVVIEGRERLGGRLESLRNLEGNPEAGGDSILGGYGRVRDLAKRFDLELIDHALRRGLSSTEIALEGKIIPLLDWPDHKLNYMPSGYKESFPGRKFFEKIVSENNPLDSFEEWAEPSSKKYDLSVYEFLKNLGWRDETINQNYEINIGRGTSAHTCSMLSWYFRVGWDKLQRDIEDVAFKIKGGNQLLPESMASKLPGDIILGKTVEAIHQDQSGVDVRCHDGSWFRGKRVINSTPLVPLKWVNFDPHLPPEKSAAINLLPMMMINKVFIIPKSEFWKEDGYGIGMWTDSELGHVTALRQLQDNSKVTGLICRVRGKMAKKLDMLGQKEASSLIISEFEKLRPSSKGKIEVVGYKSWSMDRFSGGTWSEWQPNQVHKYQPVLSTPFNRIHFCGEHTAQSNRGMEGAAESAERCAFEVLDLL